MRPIDADALETRFDDRDAFYLTTQIKKEIRNAPTISPDDVRGVGHWVGIDDFPHESWECDRCGCVVENTDDPWNYFHYCPNCGARMKGAEDGTTD